MWIWAWSSDVDCITRNAKLNCVVCDIIWPHFILAVDPLSWHLVIKLQDIMNWNCILFNGYHIVVHSSDNDNIKCRTFLLIHVDNEVLRRKLPGRERWRCLLVATIAKYSCLVKTIGDLRLLLHGIKLFVMWWCAVMKLFTTHIYKLRM